MKSPQAPRAVATVTINSTILLGVPGLTCFLLDWLSTRNSSNINSAWCSADILRHKAQACPKRPVTDYVVSRICRANRLL
jgi:hypothetical protein